MSSDEDIVFKASCSYQSLKGELVVTTKGVSFVKSIGKVMKGAKRIHEFRFDEIDDIRIETKGIGGALSGHVFVTIDHHSLAWGSSTNQYACGKTAAQRIINAIEDMKHRAQAPERLTYEILRLVKTKGEIPLADVAKNQDVVQAIALLRGTKPDAIPSHIALHVVSDTVKDLIAKGDLDGIISDDGKFVSSALIARKSVQYQVIIDFSSLFSQLQNKGIVLQSLECPKCNGSLDYPKEGNSVVCKFCGAIVNAVDIFEKFKALLL